MTGIGNNPVESSAEVEQAKRMDGLHKAIADLRKAVARDKGEKLVDAIEDVVSAAWDAEVTVEVDEAVQDLCSVIRRRLEHHATYLNRRYMGHVVGAIQNIVEYDV